MSSKLNRRAKGDKGPAKSSQSHEVMNSLSNLESLNMNLLNGVYFDTNLSNHNTDSCEQCVVYFGSNSKYRVQLKLLSKKNAVTRQKALKDIEEIIKQCTKEEIMEMMPSFCYYYNEMLYCQSFQVRLEINRLLSVIGIILGNDIGKFVKQFFVSLQIYSNDNNTSVKQFCCDLATSLIPAERRESVKRKYFDETVMFVQSLFAVDANFLVQHNQEMESLAESLDRLHTTCEVTFTSLLKSGCPLSPETMEVFRQTLVQSVDEIVQTGNSYTLTLIKEMAARLTWNDVTGGDMNTSEQLAKRFQKLLVENGPKQPTPTCSHLNTILALWMTLSVKYPEIYLSVDATQYSQSLLNRFKRNELPLQVLCNSFALVLRVFDTCIITPLSLSPVAWTLSVYDALVVACNDADFVIVSMNVYQPLVEYLSKQPSDDVTSAAALRMTSILKTYFQHLGSAIVQALPSILGNLCRMNNTILHDILLPHFSGVLTDIHRNDSDVQLQLLSEVMQIDGTMVTTMLGTVIMRVLERYDTESVNDVFIYQLMINLLLSIMRAFPETMRTILCDAMTADGCLYMRRMARNVMKQVLQHDDTTNHLALLKAVISFTISFSETDSFSALTRCLHACVMEATQHAPDNKLPFLLSLLYTAPFTRVLITLESEIVRSVDVSNPSHLLDIVAACETMDSHALLKNVTSNISSYEAEFALQLLESRVLRYSSVTDAAMEPILDYVLECAGHIDGDNWIMARLQKLMDVHACDVLCSRVIRDLQRSIDDTTLPLLLELLRILQDHLQPVIVAVESDAFWLHVLGDDVNYRNLMTAVNQIYLIVDAPLHFSAVSHLIVSILCEITEKSFLAEKFEDVVLTVSDVVHCDVMLSTIDASSPKNSVRRIGQRMLLSRIPSQNLSDYLHDESIPVRLLHRVVKKSCRYFSRDIDDGVENVTLVELATVRTQRLEQLKMELTNGAAATSIIESLLFCSCLFNKYVLIDVTTRDIVVEVSDVLTNEALALAGSTAATTLSTEVCHDEKKRDAVCCGILSLLVSLLSCSEKNEDFSILYEGSMWNAVMCLNVLYLKKDVCLIIRYMKYMDKIKKNNGFTISEGVYDSLILSFNSTLLTFMISYLQKPYDCRHNQIICSIYRNVKHSVITAVSQFNEWMKEFSKDVEIGHLIDVTILLLFLIRSTNDMRSVISCIKNECSTICNEAYDINKSMLFLLILCETTLKIQSTEMLTKNEEDVSDEVISKDENRKEMVLTLHSVLDELSTNNVFHRVLLHIVALIPFTSLTSKSKPEYPQLLPLPLLLNRPLPHLPIYTLYSLCVALPYTIQYFYTNDLFGVSRTAIQSFKAYVQQYLTVAVLSQPIDEVNAILEENDLDDVKMVVNSSSYVLSIMSGVTESKLTFNISEMFPLNITITISDKMMFLASADIEKWQVSLRQRIMNYDSLIFGILKIAKSIVSSLKNVEPCPICYCVLHPTNHSLPNKSCSQCVGMFHKDCLGVWFRTSGSHNCPLCRQPIMD